MIKTFVHSINGKNQDFCVTLADGETTRAIISAAESPETLVIMEAGGALSAIKVRFEAPEDLLNDAIRKAKDSGLIERAIALGEIQTGHL